jgi:phage terminase small subunit
MSSPVMHPLNYRQRLFVGSYLGESGGSAVDAARRAGYQRPETNGPRHVEKRQVRAAIDRETKLMPKDEWAAIVGRSPDVADALIQSMLLAS